MTLSRFGAARAAAQQLTNLHVEPVTDLYLEWIDGQANRRVAIDALTAAADTSKRTATVLVNASRIYDASIADGEVPDEPAVTPTRETVTYTTASLAAGAEEQGSISLGAGYRLLQISATPDARIRVYTSAAKRTADAARVITVDPEDNHGLILEVATTAELADLDLSPVPEGFTADGSTGVPIAVANTSGSAQAISLTLTFVRTE